jgi:hypothetical protein
MKVFFSASTADFMTYREYYFAIRDFLIREGHVLTRDWLKPTYEKIQAKIDTVGIEEIYTAVMKALDEAELVIIEDTVSNFSTGHEITVALQRQKPTLVLWCRPKHRHFKQTFIQGVKSDYLQVSEYNLDNYQEIIRNFIKKYEHATQKTRFHLVIDEVERRYLEWAKFTKHASRTKVIRKALRTTINNDQEYQKYLDKS